jgi:hypothetical protein
MISAERQRDGLPALDLEQTGRTAILAMRWPYLLDALARSADEPSLSWLARLEIAARSEKPSSDWLRLVQAAGFPQIATSPLNNESPYADLRDFLRTGRKLGDALEKV